MVKRFNVMWQLCRAVFVFIVLLAMSSQLTGDTWDAEIVRYVPTQEKVVALTYDDGPHPTFTLELLSVLKKYHVKATFFMIGSRMEKYPDVVRAVAESGNAIANHTYTHPSDMKKITHAKVLWELSMCEEVITRMTGQHAVLFRPPKGFIDNSVLQLVSESGYKTILWSVCADHHDAPTPELMAQRVLNAVHPGAIILAHDGTFGTRWKDVAATSIIIEALRKQGYRFVTVPELLKMQSHKKVRKLASSALKH